MMEFGGIARTGEAVQGTLVNLVKRKVVFLLVIEHILAPYGSEACRRENIHFIVFFPYKTV